MAPAAAAAPPGLRPAERGAVPALPAGCRAGEGCALGAAEGGALGAAAAAAAAAAPSPSPSPPAGWKLTDTLRCRAVAVGAAMLSAT